MFLERSDYMPSWGIHFATAKRVNELLKLDENQFLFGNILPDLPNGYLIPEIQFQKSYNETHYIDCGCDNYLNLPKIPNSNSFYNQYKTHFENAVIVGYYVHLLTDQYWNTEFINRYVTLGVDVCFNTVKQLDFCLFEQYLIKHKYINIPIYEHRLIEKTAELFPLNEEDLKRTFSYIQKNYNSVSFEPKPLEYNLIPEKELLSIYNGCIMFILNQFEIISGN